MASLMDRIRGLLGVEHTAEHAEVRRDLTEQRSRLDVLDAYIEARGMDRRKVVMARHPRRRASDDL